MAMASKLRVIGMSITVFFTCWSHTGKVQPASIPGWVGWYAVHVQKCHLLLNPIWVVPANRNDALVLLCCYMLMHRDRLDMLDTGLRQWLQDGPLQKVQPMQPT